MGLNIRGEYEQSCYCQLESQYFWWIRQWRPEPYSRPDHWVAFSCPNTVYHKIWAVMLPSFAMHFAFHWCMAQSCIKKAFNLSSKLDPIRVAPQSTLWEDKTHFASIPDISKAVSMKLMLSY